MCCHMCLFFFFVHLNEASRTSYIAERGRIKMFKAAEEED